MKYLFAAILLFVFYASDGQVTFQKTYGGVSGAFAQAIHQTTDGGYIFSGTSFNKNYLIKTDLYGDTLWTRTYLDSVIPPGQFVQQSFDGGYITAGTAQAPYAYIYVIKTDSNGDTIWTKTFSGGYPYVHAVIQTRDSGYIIQGHVTSPSDDIFIIKLNSNGNLLWTKAYGGSNNEYAKAVQETADGGLIISGQTNSFGLTIENYYLVKTDSAGNVDWSKVYGTNLNGIYNPDVKQTIDGGYIIAGWGDLIKMDHLGTIEWQSGYSIIGYVYNVFQTYSGYALAGSNEDSTSNSDVFILKTDMLGDIQWCNSFDQGDYYNIGGFLNSFSTTSDSGYILTGIKINPGLDSCGTYLIKTDSAGNSSCNEHNINVIRSSSSLQEANVSTLVHQPGFTQAIPFMAIGHVEGVITLCDYLSGNHEIFPGQHGFSISPNPASSQFAISNGQYSINQIEIFNTLGEKIYSARVDNSSEQITVNCELFSRGIYFVKVDDGYSAKKLVIQ